MDCCWGIALFDEIYRPVASFSFWLFVQHKPVAATVAKETIGASEVVTEPVIKDGVDTDSGGVKTSSLREKINVPADFWK